jgi:hypothetical protein
MSPSENSRRAEDEAQIAATIRRATGFSALRRLSLFARAENERDERERRLARRLALALGIFALVIVCFLVYRLPFRF